MLSERKSNVITGWCFLILSIVVFFLSLNMNTLSILSIGVSSSFFPIVASVVMFVISVALLQLARKQSSGEEVASSQEHDESKSKAKQMNVGVTFVLILFYLLLLPILGFILATTFYLVVQSFLLATKEKRNLLVISSLSLTASVVIYHVFRSGFDLMLPVGVLG
ncbi:tripartite tricarboxylate transporter TctB family protein [Geomicrobium sp. JCM 19055]|uniref:tripartite tricarboxylate transporter TctB family protein n=1 Tax=Geomicrobium sp. JCM 19055 TaxID=1460649 RepID=UPI00045ED3DD|nr:tripartite tricarboxylate transporter TctB family protein [Geomicrobium sp. JCM 19055]GAK00071.1 tricarboxylate transport protein TctB [Geomicrobium sp. JCM 19055]